MKKWKNEKLKNEDEFKYRNVKDKVIIRSYSNCVYKVRIGISWKNSLRGIEIKKSKMD